jgi:hypothetical protein
VPSRTERSVPDRNSLRRERSRPSRTAATKSSLLTLIFNQYFEFKAAVERLVGRPVDLVEMKAMADSRLKRVIERTQVPVYEQAA